MDPRRLLRPVLDLLFPPRCARCRAVAFDEAGDLLCAPCRSDLPPFRDRCERCGRVVGPGAAPAPCGGCRGEDLALDGVVAAFPYAGAARDLVVELKYGGRPAAARPLGLALAAAVRAREVPGDLLVPVPLSRRRLASRGYNQAEHLAEPLARDLDLERGLRALRRVRDTAPQTGRTRAGRLRGPLGAFRADRRLVDGRAVLLVDDVLTTGGTARAAARALRRAGAAAVTAAVACRTEAAYAGGMDGAFPEGGRSAVIEVSGRFADEDTARAAAEALNRWFRWILEGTGDPAPPLFEPFGLATADWAWRLEEDVDWRVGPHARAAGAEVRVALETHDTWQRIAGLLRALGARSARVVREES